MIKTNIDGLSAQEMDNAIILLYERITTALANQFDGEMVSKCTDTSRGIIQCPTPK